MDKIKKKLDFELIGVGKTLYNSSCAYFNGTDLEVLITERYNKKKYSGEWPWRVLEFFIDSQETAELAECRDVMTSLKFEFALEKWEPGNEQAAYFEDNTLFSVTKALFIISKETNQSIVSFNLPDDWRVTTPWDSVAENSNKFLARNATELINNSVVVGKQGVYSFKQDNFTYTLAQIGTMKESEKLMAEVMKKQLNAYKNLFGGLPKTNYLQVMFKGPEDGEAYTNSSAFTTSLKPARHNIILWGNTLGHELFHKWNGINNLIS